MLYKLIGLKDVVNVIHPPFLMLSFGLFVAVNLYLQRFFVFIRFPVNYKFLLLVTAMLLSFAFKYVTPEVIEELVQINPRTLLIFVHPLIILKVVFELDIHLLWKMILKIFLLSTVGVYLVASLLALLLKLYLVTEFSERRAAYLVYTSALAAVDGLEMSEVLSEIEGLRYVLVIIQSESVLGTGTSIMLMDIITGDVDGYVRPQHYVCLMIRYVLGGIIIGKIFGILAKTTMNIFYNETNNTIIACLSIVYLTYYISDCVVNCSAPLATFIVVYSMSRERAKMPQETLDTLHLTWNILYSLVEYLMFVMVVTITFLRSLNVFTKDMLFQYISIYIASSMLRIVTLIVMSPFLLRLSPRLETRNIVALSWMSKKGVIQLILVSIAFHTSGSHPIVNHTMAHTFAFFMMYILFNSTSTNYFFKIFGLTLLTKERKSNMNSCLRFIETNKEQFLQTLKLSRQLSVVDWSMVEKYTKLTHGISFDWIEDNDFLVRPKKSVCLDCKKEITIQPTRKELTLMMEEAKRRVLKAQKVSFIRQLEKGQISKDGVTTLLTYYESAIDSKNLVLNVETLKNTTDAMKSFEKFRHILQLYDGQLLVKKPRNRHRRICYRLMIHRAYGICLYLVTILAFLHFCLTFDSDDYVNFNYVNYVFIGVYLMDCIIKLNGMTHVHIADGFTLYFSNNWCKLDFMLLVLNIISAVAITVKERSELAKKDITYDVMLSSVACLEVAKIVRLLKIIQIIFRFRTDVLKMYETRIGFKLADAFDLADAMMIAYEEVLHLLPTIIENENIRKQVRERMIQDNGVLAKQLAFIEKTMPGVAARVKTQEAIRSTLVAMKEEVDLMKTQGSFTIFEHTQLMRAIQKRYKSVALMKYVQEKSPEVIVSELPWCANCPDLATFFNVNSTSVNFEANESISWDGYDMQGIYVITDGVLKMKYKPHTLSEYSNTGAIPIMENIVDATFDEPREDFLLPGNTLGELSTLTGRDNQCDIYSEIPVKTIFIPKKIVEMALLYSESSIDGFYNALWLNNAIVLAASILWEEPMFRSFKKDELLLYLMKGMIPNLTQADVFVGSELIEDIVLIEGKVKELYTEDIYCAPCYLPRSCKKLVLIKNTKMLVNPILFVLPLKSMHDKNLYCTQLENEVDYEKYQSIREKREKMMTKFVTAEGSSSKALTLKSILRKPQSILSSATSLPNQISEELSIIQLPIISVPTRSSRRNSSSTRSRYSSPSTDYRKSRSPSEIAEFENLKFEEMKNSLSAERKKYNEDKRASGSKFSFKRSSSNEK